MTQTSRKKWISRVTMTDTNDNNNHKYFDDFAKLAGNAFGIAGSMGKEFEAMFQSQIDMVVKKMNLVSREELEAAKAIAVKARDEQEALKEKIKILEEKIESHNHDK